MDAKNMHTNNDVSEARSAASESIAISECLSELISKSVGDKMSLEIHVTTRPALSQHPLLDVKQAAELANLSDQMIRHYISNMRLRAIKFGNVYRIRLEDLNAFLEEHCTFYIKDGNMIIPSSLNRD